MSQTDIKEVELSIEHAKGMVMRGHMAQRLAANSDFKKLVLEGYFVEEAARLAHLSSDPNIPEEVRAFVMRDLNGVGAFKRYLSAIVQMGLQAETELQEQMETLDEIRSEELGEVSE